jgi:hypothetical protein
MRLGVDMMDKADSSTTLHFSNTTILVGHVIKKWYLITTRKSIER